MTRVKIATLAIAAGLLLAIPAPAAACQNADTQPAQLTVDTARSSVRCLINKRRRKAGLSKVRSNGQLTSAAQNFSILMNVDNFFSHFGPSGSSPLSRITKSGYLNGYGTWGVGENLRYGSGSLGTPRQAVIGWMHSPPHRRTMLNRRYRDVGVGVALGSPVSAGNGNAAIYTADFGYRS